MDGTRSSDILNYIRVDDRLTSSGQPTIEELDALAREGTEVLINLALHDAAYALPDEAGSAAALGIAAKNASRSDFVGASNCTGM